ncbi:hypothetical protein OAQ34_10630, partial [Opitutales bacterium]|nr:hypothetical protein [Opitutales bacterium]
TMDCRVVRSRFLPRNDKDRVLTEPHTTFSEPLQSSHRAKVFSSKSQSKYSINGLYVLPFIKFLTEFIF